MDKYHLITHTEEGRVFNSFESDLPKLKKGTILDLGCSSGVTTKEISNFYPNCVIIGVDINPEMIDRAKQENSGKNITYLCQDAYDFFNPKEHSFDIIFAMNNLYYEFKHRKANEPIELLKKTLDLLKEEGYLLISNKTFDRLVIKKRRGKFKLVAHRDEDWDYDILDIWGVIDSLNK